MPFLPRERDPRLVTIRRGGTLGDEHHRQLASWALDCVAHVLPLFEERQPGDGRPRHAIRAAGAAVDHRDAAPARAAERQWQRERLPEAVRALVLEDQKLRNAICWNVFGD
ncbi:hypothetical protein KRR55_07985 [Paeniglutamicibacter sp. ABSL32-1]|uniref:putative immunity protein n=1 Tax=Paeniglutamicibacter quisquiliarum TaxID=2849498 RepID=UPI001C2D9568|nr:hypothetical protein [Paeniglutamicibacter quisquiliarum]MBV1779048.1 hypothetical protein [Paeniglutamicibacter quisquiliarum]